MQKFLLFISLFLTTQVYAQPNYFANNPEWNQASSCIIDGCNDFRDYVYYINGDSTLNTFTYKKFYKRGQSVQTVGPTGPDCGPHTTYNELAYLVRQDGYQVYLWDGVSDTLLYDFDVAVGDTFPKAYNVCDKYIVLDSMEQIPFGGQTRRKLFFTETTTGSSSTMIEGIGWPVGFFEPVCEQVGCGYQFNCFSLNEQVILGTNCFFEANLHELSFSEQVQIIPNPIEGHFEIQFPKSDALNELRILSYEGQVVANFKSLDQQANYVGIMKKVPSGVYIVELSFSSGKLVHKKVLIH